MSDITMPPFLGQDNNLLWFLLIPAIIIVALIAIISYCVEKRKKQKPIIPKEKIEPFVYANNESNDIVIITKDSYKEIILEITLCDNNLTPIKVLTIKELNFKANEQRVVSNINDFNAYQVTYKIINYK